jgi:hypothetical protein
MPDKLLSLITILMLLAGVSHPSAALAGAPRTGDSTPVPGPPGSLVGGSGAGLCFDEVAAPAAAGAVDGVEITVAARDELFAGAPEELRIARHLRSSWMASRDGPRGLVTECLIHLFDTTDLAAILAWWSADHPFRHSSDLTLPPGAPGDRAHLFEATDATLAWTYLFHRHNVVAEITLIDPDGTEVTPADVVELAAAMDARIDAARGHEPLPEPPPSRAEIWLRDRVPSAIGDTCAHAGPARPDAPDATLSCTARVDGGSVAVTYRSVPDRDALRLAYATARETLGVPEGVGGCAGEWPAEEPYTIGGSEAGRVACIELADGRTAIAWSDERLGILVEATATDVGRAALFGWWLDDAGPIDPGPPVPSPTPSSTPMPPVPSTGPDPLAGVEGTTYRSAAYGLTMAWPDSWRPTLSAPTTEADDLRLTNDVSLLHLSTFPFSGTPVECVDLTIAFYTDHASYSGVTPAVGPDGAPMRGSRTGSRDDFAVITLTYLDRDPPQDLALHLSCWELDGHPGAIARVTLAMPVSRLSDQLRELDAILDTLRP